MRLKVILAKSKMKNLILIIHLISHNHFLYTVYHLCLLETIFNLQKPHFSTHKPIKLDIETAKQLNNDIPSTHQNSNLKSPQKITLSLVTKPSSTCLWPVSLPKVQPASSQKWSTLSLLKYYFLLKALKSSTSDSKMTHTTPQ